MKHKDTHTKAPKKTPAPRGRPPKEMKPIPATAQQIAKAILNAPPGSIKNR